MLHGPYWVLPRRLWRWKLHGSLTGRVEVLITEEGHLVMSFELNEARFATHGDLVFFQCVAYARGGPASVKLERLELVREG